MAREIEFKEHRYLAEDLKRRKLSPWYLIVMSTFVLVALILTMWLIPNRGAAALSRLQRADPLAIFTRPFAEATTGRVSIALAHISSIANVPVKIIAAEIRISGLVKVTKAVAIDSYNFSGTSDDHGFQKALSKVRHQSLDGTIIPPWSDITILINFTQYGSPHLVNVSDIRLRFRAYGKDKSKSFDPNYELCDGLLTSQSCSSYKPTPAVLSSATWISI